ncbi:hypothetical protein D6774_01575 [Candidatus Woesearchaeota archaeon]|nr:MAG: hypothetical protein D6774_01575 [Candidatus Woesearchaeota archaeon]
MNSLTVEDFHLERSLTNGQFHQWTPLGKGYLLKDGPHVFYVEQEGSTLHYEGVDEEYITTFLGLNQNYSLIVDTICCDDILSAAITNLRGMRLFKQDVWSCMISFIISSNNNIKRIMKNVDDLCTTCGTKKTIVGVEVFSFPSPAQIAHADLSPIRLGYREKYIRNLSLTITAQRIKELEQLSYPQAKKKLMELPGIGPKVADCICLFSLGHFEAFPIDTWINKVLDEYYFGEELTLDQKQQFVREYFGEYGGYAQQFLFQWARMNL